MNEVWMLLENDTERGVLLQENSFCFFFYHFFKDHLKPVRFWEVSKSLGDRT